MWLVVGGGGGGNGEIGHGEPRGLGKEGKRRERMGLAREGKGSKERQEREEETTLTIYQRTESIRMGKKTGMR